MSSALPQIWGFSAANALHLLGILVLAAILVRLLRRGSNSLIATAPTQARPAQQREQQTRAIAGLIYRIGSKVIWGLALLTALPEFGIDLWPGLVLLAVVLFALALGCQNAIRDVVAGFCVILEDQYLVGDTVQSGDFVGRVEQFTLRRTLIRDVRGALVTLPNGEVRAVSNLSRDWGQGFVDIAVSPEAPLEKSLQALEAASAELRGDPAWSQALMDGPRVLGVQAFDRTASTLRLQVRTAPTRQEEVCRELRRRIQLEFQRRGIPLSSQQSSPPFAIAETPLT